jgi:hypothetical protein
VTYFFGECPPPSVDGAVLNGGFYSALHVFPESALRQVWMQPFSTEDLLRVTYSPKSALRQVWLEPFSTEDFTPRNMFFRRVPSAKCGCNLLQRKIYSAKHAFPESALRQVWLEPSSTEDLLA